MTAVPSSSAAGPGRDDVLGRLAALDSCVVSDALDALSMNGALSGITAMTGSTRVVGRVHTVRLGVVNDADAPARPVHLGARAIEACEPGDVILVANAGRIESGAWGGLLSIAAKLRGVGGVVIDGACRDIDEAADLDFAVFARAATPVSARGRTVEVATDEAIDLAGVTATAGDYVVADRSGVVVIPAADIHAVVEKAESLQAQEVAMVAQLDEGAAVTAVLDHRYEHMLSDGDESSRGGSHSVEVR